MALVFMGGKKPLCFQRRHAAGARGGNRLAEYFILHVAGGKHAGDICRGAAGSGDDVIVLIQRKSTLENFGIGRVGR